MLDPFPSEPFSRGVQPEIFLELFAVYLHEAIVFYLFIGVGLPSIELLSPFFDKKLEGFIVYLSPGEVILCFLHHAEINRIVWNDSAVIYLVKPEALQRVFYFCAYLCQPFQPYCRELAFGFFPFH